MSLTRENVMWRVKDGKINTIIWGGIWSMV
jgi:hypothetical protein